MTNEEIKALLLESLSVDEIHVKSEGSHYQIIAVGDELVSMSRVKRQQAVYAPLSEKVADGTLHAISIKTFSAKDWQRERQFHEPL
jgi:acid stress-induced BolA-like protein IbaG/YrbA